MSLQPSPIAAPSRRLEESVADFVRIGNLGDAENAARQNVRENPSRAAAHHDLAVVLAMQQKLPEAIPHFRRALEIAPHAIDALRNYSVALSQIGTHDECATVHRRIVEHDSNSAQAWREFGAALRRAKDPRGAVAAYERSAAIDPHRAETHHELAMSLADAGEIERAVNAYRRAIDLKPNFPEAWNNLGVIHEDCGNLEAAVAALRKAAELAPHSADAWNNLGVALASQQSFEEAIASYQRSLQLNPNYAAALNNLGNALRSLGRNEESISALRRAIRLRPDYAEAYNNLAIALVQVGRHEEAMRYYDQAIYYRPDYPEAHMNRGLDRLALGEFAEGWIEYEWRWRGKALVPRPFARSRWDGSSLSGKRLLVHFEQGLGDTLQFIRYVEPLKKLGATVIAEVQKPLVTLLSRCSDVDEVIASGDKLPSFDCYAPLLSLPGLLRTSLETIPANVPYIRPEPAIVDRWRSRLNAIDGFKIAIAWQGNPQYRNDRHRSIPLRHFAAIAQIPGVRLISLQKGFGTEQLDELRREVPVIAFDDVDGDAGAFMDTAAIMKCVDLVITSDTAIPHLAGAVGAPVWLALPVASDWRWLHGREDSPWYPTMRLFRQHRLGEWEAVFSEIAEAVRLRLTEVRKDSASISDAQRLDAESLWREGVSLAQQDKLPEAERRLRDSLRHDRHNAHVYHDLGVVLAKQKQLPAAVDNFRQALELDPRSVSASSNLGLALLEQDKVAEAISAFHRALALGPNAAETYNNLAVAYMRNAQPALAAEYYQLALRLRPDYPEAHLNLGRVLLAQGQFINGWIEYEWRWRCQGYELRPCEQPRWGGEPLADRTLLLRAEQGLGDTLQFVRYANVVKQSGGKVLLECQPSLVKLLRGCPGIDEIIPSGSSRSKCDVVAPLMSLPGLLQTTLDTIPSAVPYLFAAPELIESWRERMAHIHGYKAGIFWQGNTHYDGDHHRSIPLARFEPLTRLPNVQLISLQKGPGVEQLADLTGRLRVIDFGFNVDERAGAFMDTAAMMMNLDLVITSDSAVAHLAGALGVPVWVALSKSPDFRWLLERDDSPWYPTMRLFRQRRHGDWGEVFARITDALRDRVGQRPAKAARPTLSSEIEAAAAHEEARQQIGEGKLDEAIAPLERALRANPKLAEAHLDLGVILAKRKHFERGVAHLRQAVELSPQTAMNYGNLGLALLESGQASEAVAVLRTAIRIDPNSPALHLRHAMALVRLERCDEAIAACQEVLRLESDSADAYVQLGTAYRLAGKFPESLSTLETAKALRPNTADIHNLLGLSLERLGRRDDAIGSYREAVRLRPDFADCWNNLGVSCADAHRLDEAVHAFRQSLFHRPDAMETHRNLGIALLLQGDLFAGWQEYEWRRKGHADVYRGTGGVPWDGSPLAGRSLFIFAEQGLGDTLQFIRYIATAKASGAHVIVAAQRALLPLLARVPEIDELIGEGDRLPRCDYYVPMLSLACGFRTKLETIPADVPYLSADPELIAAWRNKLGERKGFRIGIAWQGNPSYAGDQGRSIPLQQFLPLAAVDEVELVNLQKGHGSEQIEQWGESLALHVLQEVDTSNGAFMDTAAIMQHLDLVITSDSAIAHLAGALARPVWMPTGRANDWRWMRGRDDSPWYPTMRLFRQDERGTWEPVFERIAQELQRHVATT